MHVASRTEWVRAGCRSERTGPSPRQDLAGKLKDKSLVRHFKGSACCDSAEEELAQLLRRCRNDKNKVCDKASKGTARLQEKQTLRQRCHVIRTGKAVIGFMRLTTTRMRKVSNKTTLGDSTPQACQFANGATDCQLRSRQRPHQRASSEAFSDKEILHTSHVRITSGTCAQTPIESSYHAGTSVHLLQARRWVSA